MKTFDVFDDDVTLLRMLANCWAIFIHPMTIEMVNHIVRRRTMHPAIGKTMIEFGVLRDC